MQTLIRVGSCGGLSESVRLGDIICATGAGTDSAAISTLNNGLTLPSVPNWDLLFSAMRIAEQKQIPIVAGPVFTSDLFYGPSTEIFEDLGARGILGVEMEVAGLFTIAALEGAKSLALLTVSDDIVRNEVMSSADRENTFDEMITVALEVASNQVG